MADKWFTDDVPPRPLIVNGRSGIDPDCLVAENPDGGPRPLWIIDGGDRRKVVCSVVGATFKAIRVSPRP